MGTSRQGGFNPSVGILFVATNPSVPAPGFENTFQSLSRDSVRCDVTPMPVLPKCWVVSIPQSGFCSLRPRRRPTRRRKPSWFQSLSRDSVRCDDERAVLERLVDRFQSLSRDSVRCDYSWHNQMLIAFARFNPSVGILFVATPEVYQPGSDYALVSIPQSGFCSLRRVGASAYDIARLVSIPQSGFCSLRRRKSTIFRLYYGCFNPSVGILFVATTLASGCWSLNRVRFNPSVGILFVATSSGSTKPTL